MIEDFVGRIGIDPVTKTGVVYDMADLEREPNWGYTRGPIGDRMGSRVERVRFAWERWKVRQP